MSRQVMKPSDYEREKARVMNGVDINSEKKELEENKKSIGSCVSDFTVVKELGRGSYGVVYRVLSNISKKEYVMKKINIKHMDQKHQKEAIKEAQILRRVRHENIIRYYTSFVEHDCLYIIMEYADGGDLQQLLRTLREEKRQFTEAEIVEICSDLIKAVEYLHRNNIIHRDIKTLNIFLTKARKIKLGDLGASKLVSNDDAQQGTRVGTPLYLAPELVKQQPYDFKVDIWAIGIVIYNIAVLEPPFSGDNLIALGFNIVHKQQKPLPSMYSQRLASLVNRLLDKSPATRPSASELIQLDWLSQEKSSPKSLSLQSATTATSSTRQATNFSDKIEVFDKGSYSSLLNRIEEDKEEQYENAVITDNSGTKVTQSKRPTTGKQAQINNSNNKKGESVSNDYNSVQVKLKKPTTLDADGQRIDYMNDDIQKKQKELKEKEIEKNQEKDNKSNGTNHYKNNICIKPVDSNEINSNLVQQNIKTQVEEVNDKKIMSSKYKTQASCSSDNDPISNQQPAQLQQQLKQSPSQQLQPNKQIISSVAPANPQQQNKPALKNNNNNNNNNNVKQDIQSDYFSNFAKKINPTPSSVSHNTNFKIRPFSAQLPNTSSSSKQFINKDENLAFGQKQQDAAQLEQMIKEFKQEAQKIKETASGGVVTTNKQTKYMANQQQQELPTHKIKQQQQSQGVAQENSNQLNRPQSAHPFLGNKQRQVFNQFNNRYVSAAVSPQQNQFLRYQQQPQQQQLNNKAQSLQQYLQMPSALISNKLAVSSFIQKNIGNMNSNAIVGKDDSKGRQTQGTQASSASKSGTKHPKEQNEEKNVFYRIDNVQREFGEDPEQKHQKQTKQQQIHNTNPNNIINNNQLTRQRPTTAISKVKSATSANFYNSVESNNNSKVPYQQKSLSAKEAQNIGGKPLILNNPRPQTASTLRRKYTIKDLQPSDSTSSLQAKAS